MSKYFVFVKINVDKQPAVASQFNVSAIPAIKFMKPDGTVVHEFVGYRDLATYIGEMKKALQMAGK